MWFILFLARLIRFTWATAWLFYTWLYQTKSIISQQIFHDINLLNLLCETVLRRTIYFKKWSEANALRHEESLRIKWQRSVSGAKHKKRHSWSSNRKLLFLAAVHIVIMVFVWDSSAYPYYINLKILNEVQHFAGWLFLKMSTESLWDTRLKIQQQGANKGGFWGVNLTEDLSSFCYTADVEHQSSGNLHLTDWIQGM